MDRFRLACLACSSNCPGARLSRRLLSGRLHRRGAVTPAFIIVIGVIVAALALAVDSANLWQARIEMRNSADAAALAGALALVDDELLTFQPGVMKSVCERARRESLAYAMVNPVLGMPLRLEDNPDNAPNGDLVFGFVDDPSTKDFQAAESDENPLINLLRVVAQRSRERGNPVGTYFARFFHFAEADVAAMATGLVDRDVYGMRPQGNQPMPLAPLALLTDPRGSNPDSWEAQTVLPALTQTPPYRDSHFYDRQNHRFLKVPSEAPAGDGIHEMEVRIPIAGQPCQQQDEAKANGCFLEIGAPGWETIARQLATGVHANDLVDLDGQFALGPDSRLLLPGLTATPKPDAADFRMVLNALNVLQTTCEPRVWPLFAQVQSQRNGRKMAVLQGFVAARVISANVAMAGQQGKAPRQQLSIRLQPCAMATATALTDRLRRHANPEIDLYNRYVCKVRLLE